MAGYGYELFPFRCGKAAVNIADQRLALWHSLPIWCGHAFGQCSRICRGSTAQAIIAPFRGRPVKRLANSLRAKVTVSPLSKTICCQWGRLSGRAALRCVIIQCDHFCSSWKITNCCTSSTARSGERSRAGPANMSPIAASLGGTDGGHIHLSSRITGLRREQAGDPVTCW